MAETKRKSIFTSEYVFNLSDPQPTWLFDVFFYKETTPSKIEMQHLIADNVTLPTFDTEIVTKKFYGSEKSWPVLRTYGTDVTMEFTLRSEWNHNKELYRLSQVNGRNLKRISLGQGNPNWNRSTLYPVHPEIEDYSDNTGTFYYNNVKKICVKLKNKMGHAVRTSVQTGKHIEGYESEYTTEFQFENCILKSFEFTSGLDYSSEDVLKCTLTYHSDIWNYTSNDIINWK